MSSTAAAGPRAPRPPGGGGNDVEVLLEAGVAPPAPQMIYVTYVSFDNRKLNLGCPLKFSSNPRGGQTVERIGSVGADELQSVIGARAVDRLLALLNQDDASAPAVVRAICVLGTFADAAKGVTLSATRVSLLGPGVVTLEMEHGNRELHMDVDSSGDMYECLLTEGGRDLFEGAYVGITRIAELARWLTTGGNPPSPDALST